MTAPDKAGWWWRAACGPWRERPVDVGLNVHNDGRVFRIAWYDENNGWRSVTDDGYWRGPVLSPDEAVLLDSMAADLHAARVTVGKLAIVQADLNARIARLERVLAVEGGGEGAPDGWFLVCRGCWSTHNYDGSIQREDEIGSNQWRAFRGGRTIGWYTSALEAMEAADVAEGAA